MMIQCFALREMACSLAHLNVSTKFARTFQKFSSASSRAASCVCTTTSTRLPVFRSVFKSAVCSGPLACNSSHRFKSNNLNTSNMASLPATTPKEVLDFWFGLSGQERFAKNPEMDAQIRDKFLDLHGKACAGQLESWKENCDDCLALVIVLDQFSRNMFRDKPEAFGQDSQALATAKHALAQGYDKKVPDRALFFYLPFMHSEDVAEQNTCVELCHANGGAKDFAVRHLKIVERFGRFPHRNECLGRASTEEEIEFLKGPGSSF